MRAAALQHLDYDGPGLLVRPLEDRGWSLEIRRPLEDRDSLHGLEGQEIDLLIVLGGTRGVYESGQVPYLQEEIRILRERIGRGHPVRQRYNDPNPVPGDRH